MSKSDSRKVIPEPVLAQDLTVPAHHHQPQVPDLAQGFVYHLIQQIHQEPNNPYLSYFSAPVLPHPHATPAQFAKYLELALLSRQEDKSQTITVQDSQGNTTQLASLDVDSQWKFPYDLYPHAEQQFRAQHGATSSELREECWLPNISTDFYREFPVDFDRLHDEDDEDDDYLEEFEQIFGFNFAQMANHSADKAQVAAEDESDAKHEAHQHEHHHDHEHHHKHHCKCKDGEACDCDGNCDCGGDCEDCDGDCKCGHDHEHQHGHHHHHGDNCACGHDHHHEHHHHDNHHGDHCDCGHDHHHHHHAPAYETIDLRATTATQSRFTSDGQPRFTLNFNDEEYLLSDEELDESYAAQARGVTGHEDLVTRVLNDLLDYVDHDRIEMFELRKFNNVLFDYTTLEHQVLQQWRNTSLADFAAQLQPYKWNLKSFKDYQVGLQPRNPLELERNFNRTLKQLHIDGHFSDLVASEKFDVQTLSQIFIEYVNAHYDLEELDENSDSQTKFLENPLSAPLDKFYADFLDPIFAPKFLRLVRSSVNTSDPLEALANSVSLRDYLNARTLAPLHQGEKSLTLGSIKSNHVSNIVDYFARLVLSTDQPAPLTSSHNFQDSADAAQGANADPYAGMAEFATCFLDASKYPQFAYLDEAQKLTIAHYRQAQWQRFITQVQDLLIQYYWVTKIFYRRKLGANNFKLLAHCYFIELHQFLAPHQDGFGLWYSLFYSAYYNCYSEYEIQPLLYLQLLNATFNCGKLNNDLLNAFEHGWLQAQNVFPSLLLNHCALIANQSIPQFSFQQAQVYATAGYDPRTGVGSERVQQLQEQLTTPTQGSVATNATAADGAEGYGVHASVLEQGTTIPQTSLQVLNNSMHRTSWVGYFDWAAQRVQPLTVFHQQYYADYYKLGNTFIHAPHLPQGMWIWEGVQAEQVQSIQSLSSALWSTAHPAQVTAQHLPTPTSLSQVTPYLVQQTFVQDHYLYCRLNYDFFPAWGVDYRAVVRFYDFARQQREFAQGLEDFYAQLTRIVNEMRFSSMRSERLLGFCVGLALSRNSFYKQVRVAHDSLEAQEQASMNYQHQLEFERALKYYCNLEQELTPAQQQSLDRARQFYWAVRQVLSFARVAQPVRLFHLCLQPNATRDFTSYYEAIQEFLGGATDGMRWSYNHTVQIEGLLGQFETIRKMLDCIVDAELQYLDAAELVQYRNEFNRVVHGFTRGTVTSSGLDEPGTAGEQLIEISTATLLDETNPLSMWLRCCLDPLTYHLQEMELGYEELSQLRSPIEWVLQYFRTDYNTYHTHIASTDHVQALHKAEQAGYLASDADVLSQGYLAALVEKYRPQLAQLPLPAQATPELTQWLAYHYHQYYLSQLNHVNLHFFATPVAQLLWPYTDMSGMELVDAQEYEQRVAIYNQRMSEMRAEQEQALSATSCSYPATLRGLELNPALQYDINMRKPQ